MSYEWFPWYPALYRADTMHLTPEQDGIYRRLIDHYMETRQPLPDNDASLARISGCGADIWQSNKLSLFPFFVHKNGQLHHKKCNYILDEQDGKIKKRTSKSIKGGLSRWKSEESNKLKRSERLAAARTLGVHTKAEWESLLKFCGNKCCKCDSQEDVVKDHILPIYQGGSDLLGNLQPLCRRCNSQKGPENKDFRPSGWENACQTPATACHMTRHDMTRHDIKAADKSAARQQGKNIPIFTSEQIKKAKRGEPAYDPDTNATTIFPGGWQDAAEARGILDEKIYKSWCRFKELSDFPYQKKRWLAWIENEGISATNLREN